MQKKIFIAFIVSTIFITAGCEKETQPAEENDNELITTIQLDFTKRGSDDMSTFAWEDPDGPGGELPDMDSITLDDNTVYDVRISFWNKSVTPAEDITEEVKAESANHRIYYEASAGSGITIREYDNDINGMPLGVSSTWTTTSSAAGTIVVALRHYPDGGKAADDPISSPKSSTDAGAVFEVQAGN